MPRDFFPIPRPTKTGVPSLDMLTDPFAYLDQLKKLQEVPPASAPRTTKAKEPPKRVEPAQVPPATTPPAASTPNVAAPAPASSSTPAGGRDFVAEMDMLRRSYEAERAQMAQASSMGMGPTPLQEKRHYERFMNRMGQLRALKNQAERRDAYKARARAGAEANAAERLRRQRDNEKRLLASSDVGAAKISESINASQAVNPVDAANQEYLKDLASTNTPSAPAAKAPSVPAPVPAPAPAPTPAPAAQPVGAPSPTADYVPGLDGVIRMIRGMLQTMPAAQISDLASAPTPAPVQIPPAVVPPAPVSQVAPAAAPAAPAATPTAPASPAAPTAAPASPAAAPARVTLPSDPYAAEQALIQHERLRQLAREAEEEAKAKRRADMNAASAPPPIPLATDPDIANPMGAPGPIPGINTFLDPLEQQAFLNVERRLAPTPADMRDPNFSRAFYREVQREFARLGGRSASEIIATPPVQEMPDRGVLGTLIGPGGLVGAPAPDAMVAQLYEIANNPNATPDQRARAQAAIATAQMQGGLMDLAGAGFVTGKPASPTTRVPEIPRGTPAPLPDEAARMRLDMPYVPEGRFAPEGTPLRGTTTGDIYQPVPRTITSFTPEGVETAYTMPIEPIGSALRGGPGARETRGRDVVSAGDYAQPAGPGNSEGRVEMLRQADLATDVRLKREAQIDRILESLTGFGNLPMLESSPVTDAPARAAAPAVAQPAPKAAEPAPAPKPAAQPAPAEAPVRVKAKRKTSTPEDKPAPAAKSAEKPKTEEQQFLEATLPSKKPQSPKTPTPEDKPISTTNPAAKPKTEEPKETTSDSSSLGISQTPFKNEQDFSNYAAHIKRLKAQLTLEKSSAPESVKINGRTQMLVDDLADAKRTGSESEIQYYEHALREHERINNLDSAKRPAPTSGSGTPATNLEERYKAAMEYVLRNPL